MNKIFIGGSRRLTHLNMDILTRIDNIIASSFTILVGDANGADKSVQKHCAGMNYQNVIVFCSGNECRNNIGNWRTFHIRVEKKTRNIHFYTAKDLEMAKEADYGFMIWDGKSKGTFNNINELIKLSKKVLVYFQPLQKFHKISATGDMEKLLAGCDKIFREEFEKKIHGFRKENRNNLPDQHFFMLPGQREELVPV